MFLLPKSQPKVATWVLAWLDFYIFFVHNIEQKKYIKYKILFIILFFFLKELFIIDVVTKKNIKTKGSTRPVRLANNPSKKGQSRVGQLEMYDWKSQPASFYSI